MKKKSVIGILLLMMALSGCGKESSPAEDDMNSIEQIEGYEDLSEEETNNKLIEEADKMEVVPDKSQ